MTPHAVNVHQVQQSSAWLQSDLELLGAFARLQPNDDVADCFAVAAHGILRLAGRQLCHLAFVHLLCLFDSQP